MLLFYETGGRGMECKDVEQAAARLQGQIHNVKVTSSRTFSEMSSCQLFLKCENRQKTGSFKVRGAFNKLAKLKEEGKTSEVIASSAGNHAQGVSYAASKLGMYATIVMPKSTPIAKVLATKGYGADVVLAGDNYDECYQEALRLLQRRFFCEHRQHTIGYDQLPKQDEEHIFQLTPEVLQSYCESLIGYIQAAKRNQMAEMLHELEGKLYSCDEDIPQIKLFLTDLYLSIKEKIFHLYHNADIPFPSNAEIIEFINDKYYLYEIVLFFTEQFEMIIRTIGNPSSESVMDDIIHYIEHNYMDNIKLENIAPLFGYNSSYLGKIFTKKVGQGFNVFVDKIRIEHSKDLLVNSSLKVYEISEKVGYRNVDYFHTKFNKYVKQSPAEYRKQMRQPDMEAEH